MKTSEAQMVTKTTSYVYLIMRQQNRHYQMPDNHKKVSCGESTTWLSTIKIYFCGMQYDLNEAFDIT